MALSMALSATRQFEPVTFVLSGLSTAAFFTWLIARAAQGFGGPGRVLLENRPLLYLGRISYGSYVYHPFVAVGLVTLMTRLGHLLPGEWWKRFPLYVVATVLVATASWYAIERPMQGLKRYFKYAGPSEPRGRELVPPAAHASATRSAPASVNPAGQRQPF